MATYVKDRRNTIKEGKLVIPNLPEGEGSPIGVDDLGQLIKVSGSEEPVTVDWDDVENKPTTFPPTIGTTASTAAAGNHTHAFSEITGTASAAQIPALDAAKITTGTLPIARTNAVLTGLAAGTNAPIDATDTLLVALAKLQAQIDALAP